MNDPKTLADRSWQNPEAGNKALAHAQIWRLVAPIPVLIVAPIPVVVLLEVVTCKCGNVVMLCAQMLPKEGSSHPEYPP